jgi:hypothetical protein
MHRLNRVACAETEKLIRTRPTGFGASGQPRLPCNSFLFAVLELNKIDLSIGLSGFSSRVKCTVQLHTANPCHYLFSLLAFLLSFIFRLEPKATHWPSCHAVPAFGGVRWLIRPRIQPNRTPRGYPFCTLSLIQTGGRK